MKVVALASSGLLTMVELFSKTVHVNSFSLVSLMIPPALHQQHQHQHHSSGQRPAQSFIGGFAPHVDQQQSQRNRNTHLFGYNGDAEEEEYEIINKHVDMGWNADDLLPFLPSTETNGQWILQNDFYSFLNQCSIQSFLFLLKSLRDPYTVLWLENYTQSIIPDNSRPTSSSSFGRGRTIAERSKLLNYHGLAAMNTTIFPTWNSYFSQLLEQPMEIYIIESQISHVPDYEMEIKPTSLCNRLLSIRQQISAEFVKDLSVIAEMGGHTLESYWDSLKELEAARREQAAARNRRKLEYDLQNSEDDNKAKPTGNEQQQQHIDKNNYNFDVKRYNPMCFLEQSADTSSGQSPSPLRRGNFDLLTLLTTQEAIHRVLNNNKNDPQYDNEQQQSTTSSTTMTRASKIYLTEFYMSRISSHFAGNQRYGQADAFMAELLAEMPTMKLSSPVNEKDKRKKDLTATPSTSTSLDLIDPTHIAQVVMEKRREVASEWEQMARLVPDKHLEIKRLQLTMLMMEGHFGSSDSDSSSSDTTQTSSSGGGTTTPKMVSFEEALRAKSKEDSGTCSTVAAMAAARAAAAAAAIPVTQTTVQQPPVEDMKAPPTTTRKRPLTTVPTRRKNSDFARSIQERKMGIAARVRVSVASMAVPDRTTTRQQRVSESPPPRIRATAGVGFGKKENSSTGRGATKKLIKAAADAADAPVSSMPSKQQRRRGKQRATSQTIKASPSPPVMLTRVVKDAFVSNIKEMREKAAALPLAEAASSSSKTIKEQNQNSFPPPTRVIRLKNFNINKRSHNNNNKKKSTTMLSALPFNLTSIFE